MGNGQVDLFTAAVHGALLWRRKDQGYGHITPQDQEIKNRPRSRVILS
jgi:hypothetical protein